MVPAARARHASRELPPAMFWVYIAFIAFVLGLLALDLGVLHRRPHVVRVGEALGWSALWIGLGLLFSLAVYLGYEHRWFGLGTGADSVPTAFRSTTTARARSSST